MCCFYGSWRHTSPRSRTFNTCKTYTVRNTIQHMEWVSYLCQVVSRGAESGHLHRPHSAPLPALPPLPTTHLLQSSPSNSHIGNPLEVLNKNNSTPRVPGSFALWYRRQPSAIVFMASGALYIMYIKKGTTAILSEPKNGFGKSRGKMNVSEACF